MIYPDNQETMLAKGITDEDLENILDIVHLKYIVKREGGRHDCRLALGIVWHAISYFWHTADI